MRLPWTRLAWKELVTVSVFLPVFFLPNVATSPLWMASDSTDHGDMAFQQGDLEPDPAARRKVILIPGMRMWGEARIDVHREMEENFGGLVQEVQKRALLHEGTRLAYDPQAASAPGAPVFLPNSDFIIYSYSGQPYYWSSETRQSLEESSRLLSALVARTRALSPNATMDMMGFSVGGLVILHWAQHLATPEDLAALNGILLIATPVNGFNPNWIRSVYRRICLCPIMRDMYSDSPILQNLDVPEGVPKLMVVNSSNDWMVNGKLGDGTSLTFDTRCSRFEMLALGRPVQPFSPTVIAQAMRNHTRILKDGAALEKMAEYIDLDCPSDDEQ